MFEVPIHEFDDEGYLVLPHVLCAGETFCYHTERAEGGSLAHVIEVRPDGHCEGPGTGVPVSRDAVIEALDDMRVRLYRKPARG